MTPALRLKIALRYLSAVSNPRTKAKDNAQPVNTPKGIDKGIVRENGVSESPLDESASPGKKDIRPKDVFPTTPTNSGVLNLVQTGEDLSKAIDKKVPKDDGYDAVSNLNQYLITTEGGGSGDPV